MQCSDFQHFWRNYYYQGCSTFSSENSSFVGCFIAIYSRYLISERWFQIKPVFVYLWVVVWAFSGSICGSNYDECNKCTCPFMFRFQIGARIVVLRLLQRIYTFFWLTRNFRHPLLSLGRLIMKLFFDVPDRVYQS